MDTPFDRMRELQERLAVLREGSSHLRSLLDSLEEEGISPPTAMIERRVYGDEVEEPLFRNNPSSTPFTGSVDDYSWEGSSSDEDFSTEKLPYHFTDNPYISDETLRFMQTIVLPRGCDYGGSSSDYQDHRDDDEVFLGGEGKDGWEWILGYSISRDDFYLERYASWNYDEASKFIGIIEERIKKLFGIYLTSIPRELVQSVVDEVFS